MADTQKKIVGFIDILGFKDMIHRFDSGEEPELLDNLIDIVNTAGNFLKRELPMPENQYLNNWKDSLEVKVFSDCFCISVPFEHPDFSFTDNVKLYYQYIAGFQILLMEKGYLVRGGLTIGSYYSNDNLIFSGGLVEAYELESKQAKMPRILVSEKFVKAINDNRCYASEYMFLNDNGLIFINPFNHNLIDSDLVDKMIEEHFKNIGTPGFIDKTFRELDEEDKIRTLDVVLSIVDSVLDKNDLEETVSKKYKWLKDFVKFEKGETCEISLEKFKINGA